MFSEDIMQDSYVLICLHVLFECSSERCCRWSNGATVVARIFDVRVDFTIRSISRLYSTFLRQATAMATSLRIFHVFCWLKVSLTRKRVYDISICDTYCDLYDTSHFWRFSIATMCVIWRLKKLPAIENKN